MDPTVRAETDRCAICGGPKPTRVIPVCPECAKKPQAKEFVHLLHEGVEKIGKGDCKLCANECDLEKGGLCGLRRRENGKIVSLVSPEKAILHCYEDPLPTNCCNSWFCKGSKLCGTNLAVFFYGCNFDCIYCQNWSHRIIREGETVSVEEMVRVASNPRIKCICFFGGSPEPQLPFALSFSRKILERREVMICWEWNGAGNPKLALEAGEISHISGGTVKFDLKAWSESLHMLLTGRSNRRTLENFRLLFERFPEVVSATTLLVPYYVDAREVEEIAKFLSSLDKDIPYSLLVFHPADRLYDLPVTPKSQVEACYRAAKRHLRRVHIGNLFLLGADFLL